MSTILTDHVETPIGAMLMMIEDDVVIGLEFDDQPERYMKDLRRRYPDLVMKETANPCGFSDRLRAYYEGDLAAVDGLPTKGGGTPFQERVWTELRRIPTGTTISYGELALRLGDRNATRRRPRQWPQSHLGRGAVPSRGRLGRDAHRLWRRPAAQDLAPQS